MGVNIVTGGHVSYGANHIVINSSNHNAGSAYTNPNTFMICNKKLKEIYLLRSLPLHKHRAHEHKNSTTLPFVILVLFTSSRATKYDLMCHHGQGSWQIREAFNLHDTDSCSMCHLWLS